MSDKTRFFRMTRPIKFRKVRLLKRAFVHWWTTKPAYYYNVLLVKLGRRKRHVYKDHYTLYPKISSRDLTGSEHFKVIETPLLRCSVVPSIEQVVFIDEDYFYKIDRKGNKKITHVVKNLNDNIIALKVDLSHICIQFDKTLGYRAIDEIELKVSYRSDLSESPVSYETKRLDINKIRQLHYSTVLGVNTVEQIRFHVIKFLYKKAVAAFKEKLDSITLKDLIKE